MIPSEPRRATKAGLDGYETRLREAVLLRRWNDGDLDAFNELIGSCIDSAQRLALRLTHDSTTADDVVSEALLRVHRAAANFRGGAQFKTWLHRIVVNCALDAKRKRSIHFTSLDALREEEDGSKVQMQLADPSPSALDLLIEEEYFDEVDDNIQRLDGGHRELMQLFHGKDMGYSGISETMEIPVGTVKSRLHRARQTLKERMQRAEARRTRMSDGSTYIYKKAS